jgi:hypothetical protein
MFARCLHGEEVLEPAHKHDYLRKKVNESVRRNC